MTIEHEIIFDNMKRLALVLTKMFGQKSEVAIHDFSKLPNSLIHIEGKVTKRKPGAPITDLIIKRLRVDGDNVLDINSYKTVTKEGRILKSSTTFIRDSSKKVIGAFCTNFDITDYLNTISLVNEFIEMEHPAESAAKETFTNSLKETIEAIMEPVVLEIGKQPVSMSKEEKIQLIEALEFQGVFLLKGSVDYLANLLGVSRYTVYNYIKEIRSPLHLKSEKPDF